MKLYTSGRNNRRIKALLRLEEQLKYNFKQPKGTFLVLERVALEKEDISRIKKEIETLKSRI